MLEPLAGTEAIAIAYWQTRRVGERDRARNHDTPTAAEIAAAACIRDAILRRYPAAGVLSPDEFRALIAADSTAPLRMDPASIATLLESSALRDRVQSAGLRYAIFVVGDSHEDSELITATEVPLLGVGADRTTWVTASIRDLEDGTELGTANVDSSGWSATMLFPPLPIGHADTEHQACMNIGDATTRFLAGERVP